MVGEIAKEATDAAVSEEISAALDPIKHTIFEAAQASKDIKKM